MGYTKSEKKVAQELFKLARQRDYKRLQTDIKQYRCDTPEGIWSLRNFLNKKAKEFDNKYDYRYSVLDEVFISFILEGLLYIHELKNLSKERQEYLINRTKKYVSDTNDD